MADNDDINSRKDKKHINERTDSFMKPYVEAVDKFNRLKNLETKGLRDQERDWHEEQEYYDTLQKRYGHIYEDALGTPEGSKERVALNRMENRLTQTKERVSTLGDNYVQNLTEHDLMLRERMANQVREHANKDMSLKSLPFAARAHAMHRAKILVESGGINESRIQEGKEQLAAKADTQRASLFETISNMSNTDELDKEFLGKAKKLETTKRRAVTLEAAEQVIKSKGLDTESVLKSSEAKREKILAQRDNLALQYKVSQGKTGTMDEESSKLNDLTNKFLDAQQKFIDALDESPEALEDFKKSVVDAGKAMDDQNKIVKEMNRQGKDSGNRGSMISVLDAASAGIQAAGKLYTYGAVTSENQQMAQRAQFARIQNQTFMEHYGASQGDMMALAMVQSQAAGRSTEKGNEQGKDMLIGQTIDAAGAGISAGLDISAASGSTLNPVGIAAKAAKEAARHAEALGMRGIDVTRGISVNQASIEGYQNRYDLSRATNEIKGSAMQEFYNQSATNFAASSGFGQRRSDVFSEMQKSRLGMAGLGVSTEEQAAMYQTAARSMGDVFTKRGAAGMQAAVSRAAEVGVSGVTSGQDYLARIGQVAQVGGSDKQIEDILANAVARGVDDAKSFGDMVDSLTQLSGSSAASGIDVTGATNAGMLRSLDSTRGNGLDQRLNLNAVEKGMQAVKAMSSDTGLTFASLIEQADLSNKFSDMSMPGRANAAAVSTEEARTVQGLLKAGETKLAKTTAERLGISEMFFDQSGELREDAQKRASDFVETKRSKIMSNLSALTTDKDQIERIKSGNLIPGDDAIVKASGLNREGLASLGNGEFSKEELKQITGDAAAAQMSTKVAPATGKARMSGAGEEVGGGLGKIAAEMSRIATSLEPLKAMTKATTAAGEMKLDTGAFDGSVANFTAAVDKFIAAIGEKGGPGSSVKPATSTTTVQPASDIRPNMRKSSPKALQ